MFNVYTRKYMLILLNRGERDLVGLRMGQYGLRLMRRNCVTIEVL